MGVAVSSWQLARTVGSRRRASASCPAPGSTSSSRAGCRTATPTATCAARSPRSRCPRSPHEVLDHYFVEGGRDPRRQPYIAIPRPSLTRDAARPAAHVVANFVEVWLAKEGHDGLGRRELPREDPDDRRRGRRTARCSPASTSCSWAPASRRTSRPLLTSSPSTAVASLPVDVAEALPDETWAVTIDPREVMRRRRCRRCAADLPRDRANHVLAQYLARDEVTRPDGFVVEAPTAGGHNAPPRGKLVLDETGQPVYGPRDVCDPTQVRRPRPAVLARRFVRRPGASCGGAEALGARGIQVGTLFALSADSGFRPTSASGCVRSLVDGTLATRTDALASPTGFPFKVAPARRARCRTSGCATTAPRCATSATCARRSARRTASVDYRCPAEPDHMFERKGGEHRRRSPAAPACATRSSRASASRRCARTAEPELPLVTLGDDLEGARVLLAAHPRGLLRRRRHRWLRGETSEGA